MAPFGRKEAACKVVLNVYDLNEMNGNLFPLGLGMYHSGVEISGVEYTFSSGSGVFNHSPRAAGGARFRESIEMGDIPSQGLVNTALEELRHEFKGTDYHILERNCNHFSEALIWRLLNRQLPGYVNRMAGLGSMFSCLMPQSMLKDAPVDGNGSSSSSSGGGGSSGGSYSSNRPSTNTMDRSNMFAGSGFKLGGDEATHGLLSSASDTDNGGGGSGGAVTDNERRELMRAAALKRLSS